MAPDAGSEPLAGPPASNVSLRARSRAADFALSLCPDFGHLDALRLDESIFEKTPLCQPPEPPKGTPYPGPDLLRALFVHATFLGPSVPIWRA